MAAMQAATISVTFYQLTDLLHQQTSSKFHIV